MFIQYPLLLASLVLSAAAQTTTLVAGGTTVVQIISNNQGSTTTILSTVTPAPTTSTTTLNVGQGPVGAPPSTTGTPGAPTPFTYITFQNGAMTTVNAVFTPTSPSTVIPPPGPPGTQWAYNSWLDTFGTAVPTNAAPHSRPATSFFPTTGLLILLSAVLLPI